MSDNKETKQAPAVEAGARDQYFRAWMAVTEVLEEVAPDWHKEKGRGMDKACAAIRSLAALARASEAAAGEPVLPQGFSAKRVEGHGWVIDPPSGTRWVAYEGTPAGELMQALAAPQPASEPESSCDPADICAGCRCKYNTYAQPASEQQAAEIEQYVLSVLPGVYYMDPPDGGSVTVLEQLRRMADDAAKCRAILSAKGDGHVDD